jgi:outer membrane receptor for ferrienterochelin and colicins
VFNPRVSLLLKPIKDMQVRMSWSTGFRAPQAFDADMHIAFAGGGIQTIQLDKNLKEEKSQSLSASLNWDKPTEKHIFGFTLEGFYTRLKNAFILEEIEFQNNGNSILEKRNGGISEVSGLTFEARANYNRKVQFETGITVQKSQHEEEVKWSEEIEGTRNFIRSPKTYGYYTMTWTPNSKFKAALSGIYTGAMLVPHYGLADNPGTIAKDQLFETPSFLENNLKISYQLMSKRLDSSIEIFAGITNMFNKYQNDFDKGKNRDSGYIYGPAAPRTLFIGISLFN